MYRPAELLRDLVNTHDVASGTDGLAAPADLTGWLRDRGLAAPGERATDDDLMLAVDLREGLRAALCPAPVPSGLPDTAGPAARLAAALAAVPLRVTLAGGVPGCEPIATGAARGVGLIAAAVLGAHADGDWPRLKVCAEHTCRWAFIDASKNRSRAWCSMRVCGNRTKTRAYRARRQIAAS
ncbi:CGNR zinc finger domain-containing protein [Sphaerisporangium rufum]|nr:CGNR zinc finger domain-containing protein [Sphaerisporangium rufum]